MFPQVSPAQIVEAQGCVEWTLAGKWKRKVFKCCSHLTECFGASTGKGSTTASSACPWLVPARSRSGGQQPMQSPQRISALPATFVFSHKQWTKNIHWTQLACCLHPQRKGTRRMKEKLICLSKFHQHSSQKCNLLPSARNASISIFMPMLGNFVDFILQNFSLLCLPIHMM